MSLAIERESQPPLTRGFRTLCLLTFEGASVGLAGWFLRAGDRLPGYLYSNTLSPLGRKFVILNMAVGVLLAVGTGAGLYVWRRAAGLDLAERISRRLAPLCLAAFPPLMFHWQYWTTAARQLTFLVMVGAFALTLQALMRVALETPPMLPLSIRGRIDGVLARVGDRLRRWPWLPTALVILGVLGYAIYFSVITVQNHFRLQTSGYDLGIENNLVWNAAHFNAPLFKTSVIGGPNATHIGFHETYISYLFGLPYRLYPHPEFLLVLQATLIGGAALPLYLFARRHVGDWVACLVSWVCLLYAPMHGSNLYDFHYLPFAPFFLWLTLWLVEARKDRWAALAVFLTLANREDMSLLLVFIGLYLIIAGERPKAGVVITVVAAIYFVVVKMMLMPHFLHGYSAYINQYEGLLPEGDHGFGGILKTVFGNPTFTLGGFLEQEKILYLLLIMVPIAFFAWRRPIGAFLSLPGFVFTMLATKYPPLIQISFQYTAYWTAFLFIAVVANLAWLRRNEQVSVSPQARASRLAWLVAIVAATLATSYQFGIVFQRNTAWGGFSPFKVGVTPEDRVRHADLYSLIERIPQTASVAANEMLCAQISSRKNAYTFKIGLYDADYLLFRQPLWGEDRTKVIEALRSGAYGLEAEKGEFVLFRRGAPPASALAYLRRIGG
jgi:uncharacterized membrane protein